MAAPEVDMDLAAKVVMQNMVRVGRCTTRRCFSLTHMCLLCVFSPSVTRAPLDASTIPRFEQVDAKCLFL